MGIGEQDAFEDITLDNVPAQPKTEETDAPTEEVTTEEPAPNNDNIRHSIKAILNNTLAGVAKYMRPQEEVIDSVFYVLGKESLEKLDGVGLFVSRAFSNLYVLNKEATTMFDNDAKMAADSLSVEERF